MSDATPAQPEADKITLPLDSSNIEHLLTILFGVTWMGFTFALVPFGMFTFNKLFGGVPWADNAWSTIFIVGVIGIVLSTVIISIIATVRQIRNDIKKGFSAWIKDTANLSLNQHTVVFELVMEMIFSR